MVGLTCILGRCKCAKHSKWNGFYCTIDDDSSSGGLLKPCSSSSECNKSIGLFCIRGHCLCRDDDVWKSGQCVSIGEEESMGGLLLPCNNNSQCRWIQGLVCRNGKCRCRRNRIWFSGRCFEHSGSDGNGSFLEPCRSNAQCEKRSFLKCVDGKCRCPEATYWRHLECVRRDYDCRASYICSNDNGMVCDLQCGRCICQDNFLMGTFGFFCVAPSYKSTGSLGSPCQRNVDCNINNNLLCMHNHCSCAVGYIEKSNHCELATGVIGSRYFHACVSHADCDRKLGLLCFWGLCQCDRNSKFLNGLCQKQLQVGGFFEGCRTNEDCNKYLNLKCSGGICTCGPNGMFWNGACINLDRILFWLKYQCLAKKFCVETKSKPCLEGQVLHFNRCIISLQIDGGYLKLCNSDSQCKVSFGFKCIAGRCQCANRELPENLKCQNRISAPECLRNRDCDSKNNFICKQGKCVCKPGDVFYRGVCIPGSGGTGPSAECYRDLDCIKHADGAHKKCIRHQCKCRREFKLYQGHCIPRFVVSSRKCIVNLDCERFGMRCRRKRCTCYGPKVIVAGNCVNR
ncbi:hypothetical protein ACOME3_007062 [Neoechinorhynchus agilis]